MHRSSFSSISEPNWRPPPKSSSREATPVDVRMEPLVLDKRDPVGRDDDGAALALRNDDDCMVGGVFVVGCIEYVFDF